MPVDGQSGFAMDYQSLGEPGTVPVGGEMILMIDICCRLHGIRLTIVTDEAMVVIDIP